MTARELAAPGVAASLSGRRGEAPLPASDPNPLSPYLGRKEKAAGGGHEYEGC